MFKDHEEGGLEIELGESRPLDVTPVRTRSGPYIVQRKFTPEYNQKPIYIRRLVWNQLWKYSLDNRKREVGGVLIGGASVNDGVNMLEITGFIEGRFMKEGFSSLTFTHETWNDIDLRRRQQFPDQKIAGWFHTHPGHGVFLSTYDLFIHRNFFPGLEQIAVVFDPVKKDLGFFVWEAGKVKRNNNVTIFCYSYDPEEDIYQDGLRLNYESQGQLNPDEAVTYLEIVIDDPEEGAPAEDEPGIGEQKMDIPAAGPKVNISGDVREGDTAAIPGGQSGDGDGQKSKVPGKDKEMPESAAEQTDGSGGPSSAAVPAQNSADRLAGKIRLGLYDPGPRVKIDYSKDK